MRREGRKRAKRVRIARASRQGDEYEKKGAVRAAKSGQALGVRENENIKYLNERVNLRRERGEETDSRVAVRKRGREKREEKGERKREKLPSFFSSKNVWAVYEDSPVAEPSRLKPSRCRAHCD